ncbi:ankyrin repeat protein [Acanthamoeba polyphaga moumouvirus]|uniref:Ankyrin repeat protein n=1 Tax=Acanthamoeba polyphaga moumouvirus TaxID=1269028 RepID=L7RDD5_9VIRU|nr:ankyrin repeat protein [Acanthamoeba polyphaga moumouvirus]AGC02372.1 ankyrin repeat protein [Acanthamoeba polyphaga moumouvirus]AQN68727.1 ankyrin repeat protein [Saudi moumouvirus]
MTCKNKKRDKNNIPNKISFVDILNDKLVEDKVLYEILEDDILEDVIFEINGQSYPVYNRSFEEWSMIHEEISNTGKTKLYQRDYLFLIYHKSLYDGKLHKIQITNYIKKHFVTRYECDKIGMTHLMCTCVYSQNDSNLELVKLFTNGYNINKKDNTGRTALAYALKNPGNVKIIKFLLEYLQKINPYDYLQIINGALIYWSKTDYLPDIRIAEILIDAGASVNFKDSNDLTVLINIIKNKNYKDITKLVKFLLINGVDIYTLTKINPYNDIKSKKIKPYKKEVKWSNNIGMKLVKSIEINGVSYPIYHESDKEPKYDLMDYLIERYQTDNNKKIISMLYDFGYRKLPNTTDKFIENYTKHIINDIDFRESYFKKFGKDLVEKRNEIIYKPGSLRSEIIKLSWNQNSGQVPIFNDIIFNYFGFKNEMELKKIVHDIIREL